MKPGENSTLMIVNLEHYLQGRIEYRYEDLREAMDRNKEFVPTHTEGHVIQARIDELENIHKAVLKIIEELRSAKPEGLRGREAKSFFFDDAIPDPKPEGEE